LQHLVRVARKTVKAKDVVMSTLSILHVAILLRWYHYLLLGKDDMFDFNEAFYGLVQLLLSFVFMFDFGVSLISSPDVSLEARSAFSVINLITSVTPLLHFIFDAKFQYADIKVDPLAALRSIRVIQAIRETLHRSSHSENFVIQFMYTIAIAISAFTVAACMFISVEATDRDDMTLSDVYYFLFISLTTVGYGDYSPQTIEGRWTVVAFVGVSLILLPYEITALISISKRTLSAASRLQTARDRVYVLGTPSLYTFEWFRTRMLYSRMRKNDIRHIFCAPENETGQDLREFFSAKHIRAHLEYVSVEPAKGTSLSKIRLPTASGVIVLSESAGSTPVYSRDGLATIRAASASKLLPPQTPMVLGCRTRASAEAAATLLTGCSRACCAPGLFPMGAKRTNLVVCSAETIQGVLLAGSAAYPGLSVSATTQP
ncbi:calcium-activated potassium channel Slo, partial [Kipferlia bialata]